MLYRKHGYWVMVKAIGRERSWTWTRSRFRTTFGRAARVRRFGRDFGALWELFWGPLEALLASEFVRVFGSVLGWRVGRVLGPKGGRNGART